MAFDIGGISVTVLLRQKLRRAREGFFAFERRVGAKIRLIESLLVCVQKCRFGLCETR